MKKRLSRRDVIKLTVAAAGAGVLGACVTAPTPAPPTPAPTSTPVPTERPPTATPDPAANMAAMVTANEMRRKAAWVSERLFAAEPPFSFLYGGRPSSEVLGGWLRQAATQPLDENRTEHAFTWTDPQTGLEVRCVAVEYTDYPAVEWTVYFKNTSPAGDTAILERIQGLDTQVEREGEGEFILHGCLGDSTQPKSYEPYAKELGPGVQAEYASPFGRPTSSVFPYYNLQAAGGGWIVVVGWPGQWSTVFERDAGRGLHLTAGQQTTRLFLKPGEQVRTPLIVLLFWQGADVVRAQNLWRRWFMAHNIPRINGAPPAPLTQIQVPNEEQGMFRQVEAYNAAGVDFDLAWRDAGWYPCNGDWFNTGTWEIDPKPFPNGFRPFTDWIHAQGKKFILWFEPERVSQGSWLQQQHPEWLISPEGMPQSLLNLGNPEGRAWLTEHVDKMLTEQGIDYYRQDFNMDPLYYWRSNDAKDREGLTENLHVQGYLAYWDELRRRHPEMLIDSCASGGRRNDLETLRRAVPLLRSDYQFGAATSLGNQGHTYGLSSWIPYYGTATYALGNYDARSFYVPAFGVGIDVNPAEAKRHYDECRQVAPFMLGDYYPLTPYNLDPTLWIAWQFDHPDLGGGFVQAFRRPESGEAVQTYLLRGLDRGAKYAVTDLDSGDTVSAGGEELMTKGLTVQIKQPLDAALIVYRRE